LAHDYYYDVAFVAHRCWSKAEQLEAARHSAAEATGEAPEPQELADDDENLLLEEDDNEEGELADTPRASGSGATAPQDGAGTAAVESQEQQQPAKRTKREPM
jgi:hypothetical protein